MNLLFKAIFDVALQQTAFSIEKSFKMSLYKHFISRLRSSTQNAVHLHSSMFLVLAILI